MRQGVRLAMEFLRNLYADTTDLRAFPQCCFALYGKWRQTAQRIFSIATIAKSLGSSPFGVQCAKGMHQQTWRLRAMVHAAWKSWARPLTATVPKAGAVVVNACLSQPVTIYPTYMEAFLVSTGIVALAEMGDKTQLLSLVLAARFRKPWPIVLGIFVATMINHGLAGAVGAWINAWVGPDAMRWILGVSFIAMAIWMLIPDKLDDEGVDNHSRWGVFGTTVVAFFLAEMGDKTQIATVMLAAQYNAYLWVVLGTTLGMMLANAPVVWLGDKLVKKVPIRMVHIVSAGIFLVLGVLALLSKDVPALA